MMPPAPAQFGKACFWSALLCLFAGLVAQDARVFAAAADPTVPHASNIYLYAFLRFEPMALYASVAFLGALAFLGRRASAAPEIAALLERPWIPLVVAGVLLVALILGRFTIYHDFDLCIDEYLNDFEVKILDRHHLLATVPVEWRAFAPAMRVPFEQYRADTGQWASGFLPGFASLQYLFSLVGVDWAVSPVLAAGGLLLLAGIAQRIFPARPLLTANIAVLLLAVSPQFVAMAMTKFAWTAQLFGTLLWVWLWVQPRRLLFLAAPILGALLIGLHQPHVHPLVAAPFVLRLAYTRRWGDFTWFAAWYLAGAWGWFQIYQELRPQALAAGGDLANMNFSTHSGASSLILAGLFGLFHGITLLAWSTPIVLPLLGIFLMTWRQQPAVARDGLIAALLTFGFYLFFPHPQGHGWGFRYEHAAYGLLALAAAGGAFAILQQRPGSFAIQGLLASAVFSVIAQMPYRAHEISSLVRPLALTSAFIARQPFDFVVLKTGDFWYAGDLVRNDPWLQQKPFVFDADKLTPDDLAELHRRGKVELIGAAEVSGFGVILSDPHKPRAP